MRIESIHLKNFMTFRDATIKLEPGLTIIVGLNATGKSAIFHAIKFCLGSNQRENRYDRWSEFIQYRRQSAEVEIKVNDHGKILTFARKIDRGRAPRAYIDGKRVRAADMRRVIESLGFNIDNPLVFMAQGRTVALRDASPEQILRLIEEGTGLDSLRQRIIFQETEVSADYQRLEHAIAESRAVENELHLLSRDLERLERKREYEKQRRALETEYAWTTIIDLEQRIESIKEQIKDQQAGVTELLDEKARTSKRIEELEKKRTRLEQEHRDAERELGRMESRLKSLKENVERIESGTAKILTDIEKLDGEIEDDKRELRRLSDDLKRVTRARKNHVAEEQRLQQELDTISREQDELEDQLARFEKWDRRKREAETKVSGLALQLKDRGIELRAYETKLQQLEADLEAIENKWGHVWSVLESSSVEELDERRKQLDSKLSALNESLFGERSKLADYQKLVNDLDLRLSELTKRIPPSIQELRLLLNEHGLEGVVGPISELLIGREELALAAEAVLSNDLVHSFITTERADFQLVRRLRDEIEAPAPVIYVDGKNAPAPLQELPQNSRVQGWLWNLLGLKGQDLELVRAAFGDYVVATDSKTATKMAYDGISAVTLKGEVFERLQSSVRGYPRQESPMILSTAPILKKRKHAEKEIARLQRKIGEIEAEIGAVSEKRSEIIDLLAQMGAWEGMWERRSTILKEIPEVKDSIADIQKDIDSLTLLHEKAKEEIASLIRDQPPERERITSEMEAIRIRLNNTTRALYNAQAQVKDADESIKRLRRRIGELKENIEIKKVQHDELTESLGQSREDSTEILKEIEELNEELKKHQELNQELADKLEQIRIEQRRLNTHFAEVDMQLKQSKTEVNRTRAALSGHQLKLREARANVEGVPRPDKVRAPDVVYAELSRVRSVLTDYSDIDESVAVRNQQLEERLGDLNAQVDTLRDELQEAISTINSLKEQYDDELTRVLRKLESSINGLLEKIEFSGEVHLRRIARSDSKGIHFQVRIKGDEFLDMKAGSGGEQSLLVVALILALQKHNPAPVYALDEVDTFLDLDNTRAAAQLFKEASKKSQLILITPIKSKTLLEYADNLIGVVNSGKGGAMIIQWSGDIDEWVSSDDSEDDNDGEAQVKN